MNALKQIVLVLVVALTVNKVALANENSIKVFILAGDENVLEQGIISRQKDGAEVPGTLVDAISKEKRFAFLKGQDGDWVTRDDVILYDANSIHNNTVSPGAPLRVGDRAYGGRHELKRIGPDLMLGHVLGNALDEPVFIIRYGTHSVFHTAGSRSLAHDYRPPSRASVADNEGTWDVIHFNFGIWDTYRIRRDGRRGFDKENGNLWVPLDRYEKNLREIVAKLKKTGATLIWASTTAVHEDCPTTYKEDVIRYNEVAAKIMKENDVIINDLHSEVIRQGYPKDPDVHSVGNLGPITLAAINGALKQRKTLCKPFPRVLMIGDSISSGPCRYVQKELEGKVVVYHNPGNGQHSDNGLKRIDQWLNLKSYLLKGQEFLELIDSIKGVLETPERFYPDYDGQKLELSGLVWFQGMADSKSPIKAQEYEDNLVGFIKDVRKELQAPKLPVVVVANQHGKDQENLPPRIVHDAQMVIGNPERHPEFAGTIMSVDTTPFFRDKKESPGLSMRRGPYYRPERYNNNAESFLLIGEAMGQSMLKLLDETK